MPPTCVAATIILLCCTGMHARRYLPSVGMVTIVMNDYPYLKFALIGLLGLLVLTNKET